MKKVIILLAFCISRLSFGQIDIQIVSLEKQSSLTGDMVIAITNLSDDYYAFPLEKTKLKGYNSDEICSNINSFEYPHNFFAPTLVLKDGVDPEPLIASTRSYDIVPDERLIRKLQKENLKEKRRVAKWQRKNNIKNDFEAERNMILMDHLIFLGPKEKVVLKTKFDISDIRRGDTFFYDYYFLKNKEKYDLSVNLCIENEIYNYLTDEQRRKFKKYIFFTGTMSSNSISFVYNYN